MNGLVKNNPANDPDKKPIKSRSHFKPNVSIYQTARFGECTPFYAAEVVPDDQDFIIRVNSDVDTLSLKAPFMSAMRMNKDYFFVPFRAILPNNADLIVTNPLTGDDVEPRNVNAVVTVYDMLMAGGTASINGTNIAVNNMKSLLATPSANATDSTSASALLHSLLWYRMSHYLYSEGSLLRNLGYNFHQLFFGPRKSVNDERLTFDEFYEYIFDWIRTSFSSFRVQFATSIDSSLNITTKVFNVFPGVVSPQSDLNNNISLRQLIYLIGQGYVPVMVDNIYYNTVAGITSAADIFPFNPWAQDGFSESFFLDFDTGFYTSRRLNQADQGIEKYFNIHPVVAYQLACSSFYTSDSVDFIYSCHLWHDNQISLVKRSLDDYSFSSLRYYVLNGISMELDSVSHSLITSVCSTIRQYGYIFSTDSSSAYLDTGSFANKHFCSCLFYLSNLFGFNRSLKFRDYFVGSKVRPLAVGNVDVTVSGGQFSVVDVTKNIMRQRFLNQVNRIGRSIKEYSQGIFGVSPAHDPTEVIFLGSTTDVIGAEETQNTGSDQFARSQSITSKLRTESSKFAFEGSFSEFGIVIGILSFDSARPYVNNSDHSLTHIDRFDMFNPFMQTIGDQAVFGSELDLNQSQNFGYQLRYMEYRQRVDFCAGGFHKYLPGFAFIADYRNIAQPGDYDIEINPDFIRSRSFELDDLYLALPYFTPAGYFHFIIRHDCEVSANRPMLAAPSIL